MGVVRQPTRDNSLPEGASRRGAFTDGVGAQVGESVEVEEEQQAIGFVTPEGWLAKRPGDAKGGE